MDNLTQGPSIKDVRMLEGRGVRQIWTNADRGSGGESGKYGQMRTGGGGSGYPNVDVRLKKKL